MTQALVANAADPKQVRHATRKERSKRDREIADLRAVLDTPEGRRVIWRVLGRCGIYESSVIPDPILMAAKGGMQDIGRWLHAEINDAQDEALILMMREAKQAAKRDTEEAEAVRTPRAGSNEGEDHADS